MADVNPLTLYEPSHLRGDEKSLLKTHLALKQQALVWKLDGLRDEDLRRPMTKTGTNLIGIVKHLTGVTYGYLVSAFGRDRESLPWELDEELFYGLDMWATPDESPQDIIAAYRRACAAGARTIDELDLDATGRHHTGLTVSLRWMILVVFQDTAHHAGHADIVREMIDGSVGMGPSLPQTISGDEDEYWRLYHARMSGEISRDEWIAYNHSRPGYDPSAWPAFVRRTGRSVDEAGE